MTTYLSDSQYLAIKPETTAGTAVIPTIFVPLVSESVKTIVNHTVDRRLKGNTWKGNTLLRGNRMHEGEIVILGDPTNIGHILNMLMKKGSTTGDTTDGYVHPFTVGAGDTYTFEISKGAYAQRYFGVYVEEVTIGFVDGQMQLTLSIKAMGQVSVAQLGVALTGAGMTTLILDDNYDNVPNRGLVVGDVITIGTDDVTLTSVNADGVTLGFSSTSLTHSIGVAVNLKQLAVSNPSLPDPFYLGNVLVGIGATASAATTAAGSRSTATALYDLEIVLKNNLFSENGSSRFDPVQIIAQTPEALITLKQLLSGQEQKTAHLHRTKQAITIIASGKNINPDFSTNELLTIKFNNVKLIESDNALEVGELIRDEQSFEVLYDDGDAQAMDVSLRNLVAGTVY